LALGAEARRDRLFGPELEPYRILHLASHGVIDQLSPELSGLVLSRFDAQGRPLEGTVRLHDLLRLRLQADLVVLSGCRTALGRSIKGEGLVGLARGFMYAGSPRVVASLWQVRDDTTEMLMKRFYELMLGQGMAPAAALRQAQLSIRRQRGREAPFFWGAFVLQGDWR
jgi:CHAT domain-containing protein